MKKLSITNYKLLTDMEKQADWCMRIAKRIDDDCQNLPDWFKDKSAEYYRGMAQGNQAGIEAILHANNAYAGFQESESGANRYYFHCKDNTNKVYEAIQH